MSWLTKSLLSVALVVVPWLSVGFFKDRGIKPETWCVYYYGAIVLGLIAWLLYNKAEANIIENPPYALAIFAIGLIFGVAVHIFLFQAVAEAPNPGLAVAISNASAAVVCLISPLLFLWLPQYFKKIQFDWVQFLGVLITLVGISIIAWRK